MAKPGRFPKGMLADEAIPGRRIAVHVSPGAAADSVARDGDLLRVRTTAPPQDGKANAAVARLLARALGIPVSRLSLVQGATSRDKVFRIEP